MDVPVEKADVSANLVDAAATALGAGRIPEQAVTIAPFAPAAPGVKREVFGIWLEEAALAYAAGALGAEYALGRCAQKNDRASSDHKRLLDNDQGPNTGGMGAYSPAPVVTAQVHARAMREVIMPTIKGMEKDGIPYTGFLYAGLMIDEQGQPKTLEFNCRMGDPETQPIMMRLKSDLVEVMLAATQEKLDTIELEWDRRTALGVVMAAAGYPMNPRQGDVIT